ncbi:MAG: hypothetical protein Q7T81_01180 [Pseudolabrys sp.]|nr:hypothetical protein [Pseudolabrys sp.]
MSVTALILAFSLTAPSLSEAASPKKKPGVTRQVKPHVARWTTPPGVRTPAQIERDEFKDWRRDRRIARRNGAPRGYFYYYNSDPYYYSGRFASNRFGARSGPCWTQTPIGPVWNCGR